MNALLPPPARALLDEEREALRDLRALMERLSTDPEALAPIDDLIAHLDELFLVVVVGEFNAGKSSVLNALFGEKIVEEGPIPTTANITILRHGPEERSRQLSEHVMERLYPADLLKHLNLVDTPGTNSVVRRHQEITEDFVPRADLVLFITSFDRPLSESERVFLNFIRDDWGKRLIFVLNKADLADGDEGQLGQVIDYIKTSCEELMGFEPHVFPVSAKRAYKAKTSEDEGERAQLLEASGFADLEEFLDETLTGAEQLVLKLSAPLDAASKRLHVIGKRLTTRRDLLKDDEQQLAGLDEHFAAEERDLHEGYQGFLSEVDNVLMDMERRGVQFLEDNIRVTKLQMLRDRDAFKEEFSRQVVRQNEREVEGHLTDAVDWLLRHMLGLWNWTLARFNESERAAEKRGLPQQKEFLYNRSEVFEKMRREAERRIGSYDLNEEARRILENARSAAAMFLGAQGLAVGIGAIAAFVIATSAVDVTGGFIAAGILATFGFIFLPRQKRKAIREFRERVDALREELRAALSTQFDAEIDHAIAKVRELVEPFRSLVEAEQHTLETASTDRETLAAEIERLRKAIKKTFGVAHIGD
ncbi:MAG: dynamin family protein [Rhodothermales bacterium]